MSLLHQEDREYLEELDDAARGEELTKGSSHVVIAAIIAGLVVSAAIAIYVIAGQQPPFATGQITAVWAHPQHTETSGLDASGAPMPKEVVDQVMVFTTVRLHNQTDHPIYLGNVTTNVTMDDGVHSSYAANKGDYDRVFIAYPGLPVPHLAPISALDTTIGPGQTVEGTFFSAFMMTQKQWDARKKLDYTFYFRYLAPLTLAPAPHLVITEQ
jgi:acid phosphatase family membrane protein YuiD